jgi:hypothetical protein
MEAIKDFDFLSSPEAYFQRPPDGISIIFDKYTGATVFSDD